MSKSTYLCPTCRKPVEEGAGDFPFCCERCRWVDLGEWMSGSFCISRPLAPDLTADPLDGGEAAEDLSSGESDDD